MVSPNEGKEFMHDPEGSIFLSDNIQGDWCLESNILMQQFLSLSGDPKKILNSLKARNPDSLPQIGSTLKFCLLQSRGRARPIDKEGSDISINDELERKIQFYEAIETAEREYLSDIEAKMGAVAIDNTKI